MGDIGYNTPCDMELVKVVYLMPPCPLGELAFYRRYAIIINKPDVVDLKCFKLGQIIKF